MLIIFSCKYYIFSVMFRNICKRYIFYMEAPFFNFSPVFLSLKLNFSYWSEKDMALIQHLFIFFFWFYCCLDCHHVHVLLRRSREKRRRCKQLGQQRTARRQRMGRTRWGRRKEWRWRGWPRARCATLRTGRHKRRESRRRWQCRTERRWWRTGWRDEKG